MKMLIAFYTNTGNSRRIATAMKEALENHQVSMLEIDDYEPHDLKDFELVFLGSGVYLGLVGDKIIEFVRNASNFPPNYACFYSCERKEPYNKCFSPIKDAVKKINTTFLGEFNCLGEPFNYYSIDEYNEAQKHYEERGYHPDKEDLEEAKKFARVVVKKIEFNMSKQ